MGFEAQTGEIELVEEYIDDSNRAVLGDEVIQSFGKQGCLVAIFAFNKSALTKGKEHDALESGVFEGVKLGLVRLAGARQDLRVLPVIGDLIQLIGVCRRAA